MIAEIITSSTFGNIVGWSILIMVCAIGLFGFLASFVMLIKAFKRKSIDDPYWR